MANDLSALAPVLYSAAKKVGDEAAGTLDAINMNFDDKGVAKGDTVKVPVAPSRSASDFSPSNTTSTGTDATATSISVQIAKSRKVSWNLSGEQIRSLENATINQDWVGQLVAQGMRALRNEAESDAILAVVNGASRAVGTAGTTPFASDLSVIPQARKVLRDNGAPLADLQLVIDTSAALNMQKLGIYQQAYQAGSDAQLRTGQFKPLFNFNIRESAGVTSHTAGTGSGYVTNNPTGTVGSTAVAVDTGTGTILVGDVVVMEDDTNNYVVGTALSGGSFSINAPGLREALADGKTVTVGGAYTGNAAFERSAVVGIMRPPLVPANPTIQQMLVSDQHGLTYLMLDIAQYGQRSWELHLAWGFKAINSEFICLVMG